jgi:hypothetical protein
MRSVIETTAKDAAEVLRKLGLPDNETVRITVGTKAAAYRRFLDSASRLQASAARNGMTDEIHDELLASIKTDR